MASELTEALDLHQYPRLAPLDCGDHHHASSIVERLKGMLTLPVYLRVALLIYAALALFVAGLLATAAREESSTPKSGAPISRAQRLQVRGGTQLTVSFLLLLLTGAVAGALGGTAKDPPASPFVDVPEGSTYFRAVKYLFDNKYVTGCGLTDPVSGLPLFCLARDITRAEFSVLLWRLDQCLEGIGPTQCGRTPSPASACKAPLSGPTVCLSPAGEVLVFPDVPIVKPTDEPGQFGPDHSWFSKWLCGVVSDGVIPASVLSTPTPSPFEGERSFHLISFEPASRVTRAEAAHLLEPYDTKLPQATPTLDTAYDDVADAELQPLAGRLVRGERIRLHTYPDGSEGFCPSCPLGRGEAAMWLFQIIHARGTSDPLPLVATETHATAISDSPDSCPTPAPMRLFGGGK